MKKNTLEKFVSTLVISIGIFLAVIIYPVLFVSQNPFFYKYHLSNNSEIPKNEIIVYQEISKKITNFLITGQNLPVGLMTQRAVIHMIDVRDIYQRAIFLPLIFIVLGTLLLSIGNKSISLKLLTIPPTLVFVLYLLLAISGERLFRFLFLNFHFLFYTNDLWMLDSSDLLIKLYPEIFFNRLFIVSGTITMIVCVLIVLIIILYKKHGHSFSTR